MRHLAIVLVLLAGQQAAPPASPRPRAEASKPAFEVASIKRNTSVDAGGGGGMLPGGRFRLTNVDAQVLIMIAYRTGPQLFRSQILGAPEWTAEERWDVTAKVADDLAGKPQAELIPLQPLLLQSLLADRFKLSVHHDSRTLPRYALVLARKDGAPGPQMRRSNVDCAAERARCVIHFDTGHFSSESATVSTLVNLLAANVQRFVVDRTGLDGRFAMNLEWTPDRTTLPPGADPPPQADTPALLTAIEEQLGLRLESERGPVDVVVIDHIERPTED